MSVKTDILSITLYNECGAKRVLDYKTKGHFILFKVCKPCEITYLCSMITEQTNFDLSHYNTFRLPMTAARFVEYETADDLKTLFDNGCFSGKWLHIGGGSNLLFDTARFEGTVLHRANAIALDDFIVRCLQSGLYGLENLSGIPGELFAAIAQNAGAYGVEIGDKIGRVNAFDTVKGREVWLEHDECAFAYRSTRFKSGKDAGRYIILNAEILLDDEPRPVVTYKGLEGLTTPDEVRAKVLELRAAKLPAVSEYGSAGSYFKNPVVSKREYARICKLIGMEPPYHTGDDGRYKLSAAWLIDKAGLKGRRRGGAALWPNQPLVIYNRGDATARNVVNLQNLIIKTVAEKFGVSLIPEVQRIH